MPIERYPQGDLQPGSDDEVIWRFMPFKRFVELMRPGELYFCCSDKFEDEHEGLTEEQTIEIATHRTSASWGSYQ